MIEKCELNEETIQGSTLVLTLFRHCNVLVNWLLKPTGEAPSLLQSVYLLPGEWCQSPVRASVEKKVCLRKTSYKKNKSEHATLAELQHAKRATLGTGLYLKHVERGIKVIKKSPFFLVKSWLIHWEFCMIRKDLLLWTYGNWLQILLYNTYHGIWRREYEWVHKVMNKH